MKQLTTALFGWVIFVSVLLAAPDKSQSAVPVPGYPENQVKAAFISHLFSFVSWPDGARPARICALHETELLETLRELLNAKPQLALGIHIIPGPEVAESEQCDALIADTRDQFTAVSNATRSRPVLTISDQPGFAVAGGMIELERRPARIGLIVNRQSAEAANFKISSKLLRLATIVQREEVSGAES